MRDGIGVNMGKRLVMIGVRGERREKCKPWDRGEPWDSSQLWDRGKRRPPYE